MEQCGCPNCTRDWSANGIHYCHKYEDYIAYTAGVVIVRRKTAMAAQEALDSRINEMNRRNATYAAMNALLDKAMVELEALNTILVKSQEEVTQ